MAAASWKDLDERRAALRKPLSRAEWARRAGISESTITKGLSGNKRPRKEQRQLAELVLEAEDVVQAETDKQMDTLGRAIEGGLR